MADVTVDNTTVVLSGVARADVVTWGETVLEGQPVYLKSSDNKYWKAECGTTIAAASVRGIVVEKGASGDADSQGYIIRSGPIDFGTTILTAKSSYLLSPTTGGGRIMIEDATNLNRIAEGDFVVHLGHADTTRILDVSIHVNTTAAL